MSKTSKILYQHKNNVLGKKSQTAGVSNKKELLLLGAPKETDIVFESLNIRSQSDFAKEQMKDTIEIDTVSKFYNGAETFKGTHLKAICNKYFLAVVSIDSFKGIFPDVAAKAILDFTKKNDSTIMSTSRLYIMAHRKWFRASMSDKRINEPFIIFYKENHNNERANGMAILSYSNVTQIYSSGNDFSNFNKITKYFTLEKFSSKSDAPLGIANYSLLLVYSILMCVSIYHASFGSILATNIILLGAATIFNWNSKYKKHWNSIPKDRDTFYEISE